MISKGWNWEKAEHGNWLIPCDEILKKINFVEGKFFDGELYRK